MDYTKTSKQTKKSYVNKRQILQKQLTSNISTLNTSPKRIIQSTSSPSNQHVLLAASLCKAGVDPKQNFKKSNSSKSNNIFKMNELYCFYQKPDDGELYIYCEGCSSWLHPKCAFDNNDLASTLTPEQWKTCNLLCNGSTTTIHNIKAVSFNCLSNWWCFRTICSLLHQRIYK